MNRTKYQSPLEKRAFNSDEQVDYELRRERTRRFSRAQRLYLYLVASLFLILTLDCVSLLPNSLSPSSYHLSELLPGKGTTTDVRWPWDKPVCRPPSIDLFSLHPPRPELGPIERAINDVDKLISQRVSKPGIDSIAVAAVTAAGPIFLQGYGTLRANESSEEPDTPRMEPIPVDGDSIYRIASISKMFTVLETLILREKGVLNWDDPVEKYLPEFSPPSYGWAEYLDGRSGRGKKPRITLRQLASHLAGLGRDLPQFDIGEWPIGHPECPPSFTNGTGVEKTFDNIMKAISEYPLINTAYSYPIYSNTGFSLLGLANVAANLLAAKDSSSEPQTHKDLVQRDIFNPLGLKSSFFRIPDSEDLRAHIAVPARDAEWADIPLNDTRDPSGGQYSSLSDLATVMRTFLSANERDGVVSTEVVREWLRPIHMFGGEGFHQVGAPWEMILIGGKTAYVKGGNLPGYHSEFAVIPDLALGVIVLSTGWQVDTNVILNEVGKHFVNAFEQVHEAEVRKKFVGKWANGEDVAEVEMDKDVLYLKKLFVRNVDVLLSVQQMLSEEPAFKESGRKKVAVSKKDSGERVMLWPTGRAGEFRLAFGRPSLNNIKELGCMPYWVSIDPAFISRGAPFDLVYWSRGVLQYPSAGVSFARQH